jgi:hypothetical protein
MNPFKLLLNFLKWAEGAFRAKAELIVGCLGTEPCLTLFAGPWPAMFPPLTKLQTDLENYQNAYDAADNGDKAAIKTRRKMRGILKDDFRTLAPFLESVAKAANDLSMLEKTGHDVRPAAAISRPELALVDPPLLTVMRAKISGMLLATLKRQPDGGAYEVQLATADPVVEANWKTAVTSKKARNIHLEGLTPGTVYHLRGRVITSDGPGGWSAVASIMAV